MNDALQQVSTELLGVIKQNVVVGVEYLKQQFPDLCQQIIRWLYVENITEMVMASMFLGISIWWLCKSIKILSADDSCDNDGWFGGVIFGIAGCVISTIFLLNGLWGLVKVTVAPKIALISYISSLIK